MYSYVKALALSRSIGSQWKEIDLSDVVVFDIYSTYTKVYLVLHNDALNAEVNVDFDQLRAEYSSYSGVLTQLLVELDDRTLETVPTLPSTAVKFAKYSDAIRSEYKIQICEAGIEHPDSYPDSELHDLRMTRPKYTTLMSMVNDYCLTSVNGYYHWTDSTDKEVYVYNGADTMRKSKINHLGILSFLDIGKLQKIRLSADRIVSENNEMSLREKILFTVDEDLDDKSYILIMGGYMVLPDEGVFWRSGQNTFSLDVNKLPYTERLFESNQYLDLSSLELTELPINPDGYDIEELYSDRVLRNYLTMSQSFLVVVDIPYLVSNKIHLRHSSLPGMFTAYQDPVYPLVVNYGKVAEYWKTWEDGYWSVNVQDSFLRNYVVSQQPLASIETITSQLVSSKPFYHSRGFLLELAGYRTI